MGKPVEICLPTALGVGGKAPHRIRVVCRKPLEHLAADFIGLLTYARSHPRQELPGIDAHASYRRFKHAARQPSPARVDRAYASPRGIAEQHGQAVGCEHHAWPAGS